MKCKSQRIKLVAIKYLWNARAKKSNIQTQTFTSLKNPKDLESHGGIFRVYIVRKEDLTIQSTFVDPELALHAGPPVYCRWLCSWLHLAHQLYLKNPTKPVWCKVNLTISEWGQIKKLKNNKHSLLQIICKPTSNHQRLSKKTHN